MRADVLLLVLAPLAASAQKPPPLGEERVYEPPRATRLALEGGGTLLAIEDHRLPLVTVELAFSGAGSTADPPGRAGLAAYTATVLDEGAGGLSARALAEGFEGLGSQLSIWVEEDAAHIKVSALASKLSETLELAGKLVTAPAFDPREARRVHEDQATGVRLRRDRPGAVARVVLEGRLYGRAAPYGHPATGYVEDLSRFGVAEARSFYDEKYRRAGLFVVVVGDVSAAEARRLVDRSLAGWKGAPGDAPAPAAAVVARGA